MLGQADIKEDKFQKIYEIKNIMGIHDRKKREKEMRREQIKIAAKEIFMSKGFYSAKMEDVANKAELSPATIYLYFKNKDELFASLILGPLGIMFERIGKLYNNKRLSSEGKISELKEIMYETYQYDPFMLRNIFHFQIEDTLSVLTHGLLTEITDKTKKMMEMIAEIYTDGVRQGKFVKAKGIACADIFWATFAGLVLWEEAKRKLNPSKDHLKPTLDKAFDFLLRGVEKRS